MGYRIGSFNCLHFFNEGSKKDIGMLCDIILNEKFDVVALQEVRDRALKVLLSRLRCFNPDWNGIADQTPHQDSYPDYAFIWNEKRICLANTEVDGRTKVYKPRIYNQYKVDKTENQIKLIRNPYYARFFPVGLNAPFIEIRLINAHIRFSKGTQNDYLNIGATRMRQNEFNILSKAIYPKEADKRYGNNRPAYTILLGDYNLNTPSSGAGSPYVIEAFDIIDGKSVKRIVTKQDKLTTLKVVDDTNQEQSEIFANNYDHFTYDEVELSINVQSKNTQNLKQPYRPYLLSASSTAEVRAG